MNSEQITAFLQEHWYLASVIIWVVILIGSSRDLTWRGDPTGQTVSHRDGRGFRREILVPLGFLLWVVRIRGLWLTVQ